MIFYRVSRNDYSIGDSIWETGESESAGYEAAKNREIFMSLINDRNEVGVIAILAKYNDGQINSAYMEAFLEQVRGSEFSNFPIRFKNMMVFRNLESAKYFKVQYRAASLVTIYEVEVPDDTDYFVGDMNACTEAVSFGFRDIEDMSRKYWEGEYTPNPLEEIILYPETKAVVKSIV